MNLFSHARRNVIENRWLYVLLIVFVPATLLATFMGTRPSSLLNLYGAQKFTTDAATEYLILFSFAFAAAFLAGTMMGVNVATTLLSAGRSFLTPARLQVILVVCAALVILGHLSLFYVGRSIMKHLEEATAAKQEAVLTGTHAPLFLMALTPLFGSLVGYSIFGQSSSRARLTAIALGGAVFGCVAVRFLYFERLPMFELGTPIAWFVFRRLKTRTLLLFGLVGGIGFFALFSAAEYFRSWPVYLSSGLYRNTPGDFVEFMFYRIMGYYITPVNHLNMIVREHFGGSSHGYYTFRFLLNAPVVGKVVSNVVPAFNGLAEKNGGIWEFLLDPQYGLNPEYNMFGFYGIAFLDWGWAGLGLPVLFGLVGGGLLASSNKGLTLGVLGFPIFLIGLADSPRLMYWCHERVFLSVLACLAVSFLMPRTVDHESSQVDIEPEHAPRQRPLLGARGGRQFACRQP